MTVYKKVLYQFRVLVDLLNHLITFNEVRAAFIATLSLVFAPTLNFVTEHLSSYPILLFSITFFVTGFYYSVRGFKGKRYHYFESGTLDMPDDEKAFVVGAENTNNGGYRYFVRIKFDHPMRMLPTVNLKNIRCSPSVREVTQDFYKHDKTYVIVTFTIMTGVKTNMFVPPFPILGFDYIIDAEDNRMPHVIKRLFVNTKGEGWLLLQLIGAMRAGKFLNKE